MSAHDTRLAGASHGSFRSYGIGFALSVLLTVIPFALVMFPVLAHGTTLTLVVIMAVAQVLVQLGFLLHMNRHSDEGWNLMATLFTALIIAILVVGSLWIMFHLNHNMTAH